MYKCDDDLWDRVRAYKREKELKTLNAAVTELITSGLVEHKRVKAELKKQEQEKRHAEIIIPKP